MLETLAQYIPDRQVWAFIAASLLILIGFLGSFLPVLPGTVLIYAGFFLYGLISGFDSLGIPFYLGQLGLVGLSYLVDFLASAYGVKYYGGSRAAIWGALLGSLLIFVIGPIGLLVGPLIGAIAGEMLMGEEVQKACRSGFGTFVGMLGGVVAKLIISFCMVGWFLWEIF